MTAQPRVLITGASDGIGLSLARIFSSAGADVIGCGRRPSGQISNPPQNWHYFQTDLRDSDAAESIAGRIGAFGMDALDFLVLNAGIGWVGDPTEEQPQQIRANFAVNLVAPILIVHRLSSLLESGKPGKVTLIGSTSKRGSSRFASYASSKAGLDGFARSLESEWRGRIAVQIANLGPVATEMHTKAGLSTGAMRRFFLQPEEVAAEIHRFIHSSRRRCTIRPGSRQFLAGLKARENEV